MPEGYPIRNKHIEAQHPTVVASEVITRPMTPEEWAKYGPKSDKKRRCFMYARKEREPLKKKLDVTTIIELAKVHTLSKDGRDAIAQELGVSRTDITSFIHRPYVRKALKEAGLMAQTDSKREKKQLVEDISKALGVHTECEESQAPSEPAPPEYLSDISKTDSKYLKHMDLCATLHETFVAKNTAYGDSFHATFQEFGIISALTRMNDKWNRIKALAMGAQNNVKDESLTDTLMDLANYCLMTVMELKGGVES